VTASKPSKAYFVREATGLVRSLSWFDIMILGLAYFSIPIAAFLIFGLGSFLFPGSDMVVLVSVIGLLFDLPVMIAYGMFSALIPRSGGDYVFISRSFSPVLGFAASFVVWLYGGTFAGGQNAYFTVTLGIAPYLAAIGSTSGNFALVSFAQTIVQPIPIIIIGSIMILALFVILLVPTSAVHRLLFWLFIIGFLGYPILYIAVLAGSSHAQFVSTFNSYATTLGLNTSYDGIIASARQAGATITVPTLAATLAALPLAYATLGVPAPGVAVGGETKHASRQVPIGLLAGLFVIAISTAIMGYLTYNVFGYDFISATAYYGFSGASGYPLLGAPYPNYFLAILYPNPIFNWFMLISVIAWQLMVMALIGLVATRVLFAWSFDRVVPSAMADINERFHTPVKAATVVSIACFVFLILTVYNFLGTYVSLILAQTSLYFLTMIAAVLYPFLKKDMFTRTPSWANKKVGGIPILSILGGIGAILLLVNFYYLFASPAVSGVSPMSAVVVSVSYVIFIVLFYIVKAYRKSQGIDLRYVFQEIPPE